MKWISLLSSVLLPSWIVTSISAATPPAGSGGGGVAVGGGGSAMVNGVPQSQVNANFRLRTRTGSSFGAGPGQNNYYYVVPKAGSRARVSRPIPRNMIIPSQEQAPNGTGGGVVGTAGGGDISDNSGFGVVPLAQPSPQVRQSDIVRGRAEVTPLIRPVYVPILPPAPKAAAENDEPAEARERILPISEASGPEFNDRDPLLDYQRGQAEKGNPESQYALGIRYLTGNGVQKDEEFAREWLQKSSAGGNLKARAKLRELKR